MHSLLDVDQLVLDLSISRSDVHVESHQGQSLQTHLKIICIGRRFVMGTTVSGEVVTPRRTWSEKERAASATPTRPKMRSVGTFALNDDFYH